MKYALWFLAAVLLLPLLYLWLTGPALFLVCKGYSGMLGYRNTTDMCFRVSDRFQ